MRIPVRKGVEIAVENSLLMVLGAIIALIWANATPDGYEAAVHPLHFAVNDIGMVCFFGLAVKEICAPFLLERCRARTRCRSRMDRTVVSGQILRRYSRGIGHHILKARAVLGSSRLFAALRCAGINR
jgi:hypothetical protein